MRDSIYYETIIFTKQTFYFRKQKCVTIYISTRRVKDFFAGGIFAEIPVGNINMFINNTFLYLFIYLLLARYVNRKINRIIVVFYIFH